MKSEKMPVMQDEDYTFMKDIDPDFYDICDRLEKQKKELEKKLSEAEAYIRLLEHQTDTLRKELLQATVEIRLLKDTQRDLSATKDI